MESPLENLVREKLNASIDKKTKELAHKLVEESDLLAHVILDIAGEILKRDPNSAGCVEMKIGFSEDCKLHIKKILS